MNKSAERGLKGMEEVEKILQSDSGYDYIYINTIFDIYISELKDKSMNAYDIILQETEENIDDIIECRFFSKDRELKLIKINEEYIVENLDVGEMNGESHNHYIYEKQIINKEVNRKRFLVLQKKLSYDSDGQAYIEWTRPYDLVNGNEGGY